MRAGERFSGGKGKAVLIAFVGRGLAHEDFGRHVGRCASNGREDLRGVAVVVGTRRRMGFVLALACLVSILHEVRSNPGESKVGDPHSPVIADEDVGGFDVPVDEALSVCRGDAVSGLGDDLDDVSVRPNLSAEPRLECGSSNKLHDDKRAPVENAELVDVDDVGVGELGQELGLADVIVALVTWL